MTRVRSSFDKWFQQADRRNPRRATLRRASHHCVLIDERHTGDQRRFGERHGG